MTWPVGLALVLWLLPSTVSVGQGLHDAGPRHVDAAVYAAGGAEQTGRVDLQVLDLVAPCPPGICHPT